MSSNGSKGSSGANKGRGSPASLDHQEEYFADWKDKQLKKKMEKLNWFPNSPPSPTGK